MKLKPKIYKKGTHIKLFADVGFAGCRQVEKLILDEDTTEAELELMARDHYESSISPEWWFEVSDEDES